MVLRYLLIVLGFVSLWGTATAQNFDGPYQAGVIRIIDGDTFEARVSVWPNLDIRSTVRLRGIDTPELNARKDERCENYDRLAIAAKEYLARLINRSGSNLEFTELPLVELRQLEVDNFGRIIAYVSKEGVGRLSTALDRRGFNDDRLSTGLPRVCAYNQIWAEFGPAWI